MVIRFKKQLTQDKSKSRLRLQSVIRDILSTQHIRICMTKERNVKAKTTFSAIAKERTEATDCAN